MDNYKFEKICKNILKKYYKENEKENLDIKDEYIVWLCKILKNNKALLSTNVEDGMYCEMTYNGDKDEIYVDVYKKVKNYVVKKEEFNEKVGE